MQKKYLEAGKIVNTHGIRGEVKIQPWADGPEFFKGLSRLFIDGKPVKIISCRAHKGCLIISLEGISDIDAAVKLKNRVVFIDRDDVPLPAGSYFLQDVIGLAAIDAETGNELGTDEEILPSPANDIFVIKGEREILVPAVNEFVKLVDAESGIVKIRLIEGM